MHPEWATVLTDEAILLAVGTEAFRQGAAYARDGRVSSIKMPHKQSVLFATVRGQRSHAYHTYVTLPEDGGGDLGGILTAYCTCRVGMDCKHAAAVMFAAREAAGIGHGGEPADAWERSITQLLHAGERGQARQGEPIALQLEMVAPTPAGGRGRLRVRPVVPGKNGGWVRTGISWRDLGMGYCRRDCDPRHRSALTALYHSHQPADSSYYYSYGDSAVYLDEFGPALWPLLQQAVDVGVSLVPAKGSPGPLLCREPAHVALDLRRPAPGSEATLEPVVTVGGRLLPTSAVTFLGTPAHGVFADSSALPDAAGSSGRQGLLLAPIPERVSAEVSRLLTGGEPLRVPDAHVDRFLTTYYPRLRQFVAVTSSDGTVRIPEIAPPTLGLLVEYEPGHRVRLTWSFRYEVDGHVRPVGLGADAAAEVVRDPQAEQALLSGLHLPDGRLPQLRARTAERELAEQVELRGMDAVFFTEDALPELLQRDDLVVEVRGDPPPYREVDSAPVVHLSTTDSAGDTHWFDLGVRISLDDEEVPFQQLFLALARGEQQLLLDSGTYFSIERPELEQLRRLIDEARTLQDRQSQTLRISRYQAGLWEELMELGVVEAQSSRWSAAVGRLLELDQIAPPPVPASLCAELRPYQLDGYRWLSFLWQHELGGILADDMGLGKTVQTLAMVCRAREAGQLPHPVLVVAPTSVVSTWAAEAARFAPQLEVVAVTQTQAKSDALLGERVSGADLVVTSYALFRIDFDAYEALPWSALVLDEAQFVKNHQAKTHQCAKRLEAPVKLAITGTPLENSLMDLWALLSIVAPGLFPSPQRFAELYRTPIERGSDPELLATLRRRIRPLMRRRTKEQVVAELPPKQEQVLELTLNPRHEKIYQTHLQRERQKVLGLIDDMDKNRFAIFRSLTLLRQLSLDPSLVDEKYAGVRSSKVDALLDHVREVVGEGHRALVFSQFTGFLRTVRERLDEEGIRYCYLGGRTRNRASRIEEFKNGDVPLFLISLKAGGFGLNLPEADYCFVLDPWWNPAAEAQAVDRAHRIGQTKTVMVYRLVSAGTIEEKVMELKARKQDLFTRVLDDDGLLSTSLTADDIKGLLAP
ncbi:MAG: SNF2-related protein [Actinomycetes bacterium]